MHAGAHHNLGQCLRILGQADEAIAEYWRAVELAPQFLDRFRVLGVVELGVIERPAEERRRVVAARAELGATSSVRATGRQGAPLFSIVPAMVPSGSRWQAMQSTPSARREERGSTRLPRPVSNTGRGAWQSMQSLFSNPFDWA